MKNITVKLNIAKHKNIIFTAAIITVFIAAVVLYFALANNSSYKLVVSDSRNGGVFAEYLICEGDEFAVEFIHSVNQSPVCDYYTIKNEKIYVTHTKYYAFGAGVQTQLEPGQTLSYDEDGAMIVSGFDREISNLCYIVGTVSDHILYINGTSISLRELCGRNAHVRFDCKRLLF